MNDVRVLVTVGSDHHKFDRLIDWLEGWHAARPDGEQLSVLVQYGTARRPAFGEVHRYLSHEALLAELRRCDLVVAQGGPTGIVEARDAGLRPIVVPRLRALGEVVDDHQVAFCRRMALERTVVCVESAEAFTAAMNQAFAEPGLFRAAPGGALIERENAVARLAEVVAALEPAPRRPRYGRTRSALRTLTRSRARPSASSAESAEAGRTPGP